MSRIKMLLFFAFGMFCIVTWTNVFLDVSANQPFLVVENIRDLGAIPAGQHQVSFEIFNSSHDQTRTLWKRGGQSCPAGCIGVEDWEDQPITIAPQGKFTIVCTIEVLKNGPFDLVLPVSVNDGGRQEIPLTVRGHSIAAVARPLELSLEQ